MRSVSVLACDSLSKLRCFLMSGLDESKNILPDATQARARERPRKTRVPSCPATPRTDGAVHRRAVVDRLHLRVCELRALLLALAALQLERRLVQLAIGLLQLVAQLRRLCARRRARALTRARTATERGEGLTSLRVPSSIGRAGRPDADLRAAAAADAFFACLRAR